MTVDEVQRVFRTLNDPTRIRLLGLLEREELAVQELVRILGVAQSTVSRHLAILREAGLLSDRREGASVFYRLVPQRPGVWRDGWNLARGALADDPAAARDSAALERLMLERSLRSREWFDSVGPEWDRLRGVFQDDLQRARAIGKLVPRGMRVADVGTGTGILAQELAALGVQVIAVDHAPRMLAVAADKLRASELGNVEFRFGDATELPLQDGEVDAALAHMMLHYVASPPEVVREMARVVRPGGRIVLVDFVHTEGDKDREWMRRDLGVLWQGFPPDAVERWLGDAGLEDATVEIHSPAKGHDLPATFIAAAHRPDISSFDPT